MVRPWAVRGQASKFNIKEMIRLKKLVKKIGPN